MDGSELHFDSNTETFAEQLLIQELLLAVF